MRPFVAIISAARSRCSITEQVVDRQCRQRIITIRRDGVADAKHGLSHKPLGIRIVLLDQPMKFSHLHGGASLPGDQGHRCASGGWLESVERIPLEGVSPLPYASETGTDDNPLIHAQPFIICILNKDVLGCSRICEGDEIDHIAEKRHVVALYIPNVVVEPKNIVQPFWTRSSDLVDQAIQGIVSTCVLYQHL